MDEYVITVLQFQSAGDATTVVFVSFVSNPYKLSVPGSDTYTDVRPNLSLSCIGFFSVYKNNAVIPETDR
jgi:hypothetical protein